MQVFRISIFYCRGQTLGQQYAMLALRDNPLCTRLHLLEVPCLELADFPMVSSSGGIMEITAWFAEQASCCFSHFVTSFPALRGDFEGHASVGPSSPWAPREFRIVGGLHGAQRSATYL